MSESCSKFELTLACYSSACPNWSWTRYTRGTCLFAFPSSNLPFVGFGFADRLLLVSIVL